MKGYIFSLVMLFAGTAANAQNVVYDQNAEVRQLASFTSIEVSGTISLYLSQGTTQGVAVSAGDEKFNHKIKTEVKNGVLQISVDGGMWNGFNWANRKLKAYVTITDLERLEVSGASYVNLTGALKLNSLRLEVSGASEIKGILNVEKLNMELSGASVAKLSGSAREALIDASGACSLSGYELSIDTCKISASGASSIKITANNQITAEASGGSSVRYKGAAVSKVLNSSGGSSIKNTSADD